MRLRNSPRGDRTLQVTLYAVLAALVFCVLPTPPPDNYDGVAHASLWACATAASMALVLFKDQR
jgi:hypothetical protein